MSNEFCDCNVIHMESVEHAREHMPEDDIIYDLSDLFKIFGDSTRLKILCALSSNEMCVCDIANLINMTKSSVSHQLRVLKQSRLVKYRKEGKSTYYSLADSHVTHIIDQGIEHISEWSLWKENIIWVI